MRGLGAAVPVLALGLVVVSLRRMALYDDVFGLTMLRLWVVGAAVWMGSVLVMTAVRNGRRPDGGNWLVAGAGLSAVLLVVVADVADPEAFVVRHNLARAEAGAELDLGYLFELSDDAVPALADGLTTAASPCGALPRHTASRPSTSRSPAPRTCAARPAVADAAAAADRGRLHRLVYAVGVRASARAASTAGPRAARCAALGASPHRADPTGGGRRPPRPGDRQTSTDVAGPPATTPRHPPRRAPRGTSPRHRQFVAITVTR